MNNECNDPVEDKSPANEENTHRRSQNALLWVYNPTEIVSVSESLIYFRPTATSIYTQNLDYLPDTEWRRKLHQNWVLCSVANIRLQYKRKLCITVYRIVACSKNFLAFCTQFQGDILIKIWVQLVARTCQVLICTHKKKIEYFSMISSMLMLIADRRDNIKWQQ